ncbi:venom prothrombin activator oscutarin-C catalytic subunit-like isoform X2 [Cimex lectularius]|uniref:Peptidase S1 domain-containing protein n=1 Tax=Cimex lectularius TaxID=79782 RepID=A0A8I6RQH1_CIMLE|nr:venom prothrombin activator oscutarin-C catalytic subunit-like isoform X2 [Cimex lectularius]
MFWHGNTCQLFNSRCFVNLLFILCMSTCSRLVKADGEGGKVIGGRDAMRGEFPATVVLSGAKRCGGTIISLSKIISAARCFFVDAKPVASVNVIVTAGVVNLQTKTPEKQETHLEKYHVHEKYKSVKETYTVSTLYDVAVGHLKTPFYNSEVVKPAVLPADDWEGMKKIMNEINATNAVCLATGFGGITADSQRVDSDVLKVVEVYMAPDKVCDVVDDMVGHEICASSPQDGGRTTPGDTGSSFLCGGYIIGMVKGRVKLIQDGKDVHFMAFTLFGPYMEYFELGDMGSTFQLHPAIFLFMLFISFCWP